MPQLAWLEDCNGATLIRKDCINGFVGAIRPDGSNAVVDWVKAHKLERLLVVGICTDICVMDFVLTLLSARNHDLMPSLKDISVHAGACARHAPPDVASADDDRDVHARRGADVDDLAGEQLGYGTVDAVAGLACEGFARQLEQDAAVPGAHADRLAGVCAEPPVVTWPQPPMNSWP